MRTLPSLFALAVLTLSAGPVYASDPAAARAQLEAGYTLKGEGKYEEALPHLLESLRLDPQLKTMTNLADCEEHLGKLVDAMQHWLMARDRAAVEQNDKFKAAADARVAALEARMPRVTIKLAPDAPSGTEVTRDGTLLGAISLGTPLLTDPGPHTILARRKGYADGTFTVTVVEGEQKELVVTPGAELPPGAVVVSPQAAPEEAAPAASGWNTRKTEAAIALGVAVVGVGMGTGFGLSVGSHWSDAQAACGSGCGPSSPAQSDRSTALTDATISDVSFVVAGVALASAVVLWVTAGPKKTQDSPPPPVGLRVIPMLGRDGGGAAALGTF
jgi:hypothetical protein